MDTNFLSLISKNYTLLTNKIINYNEVSKKFGISLTKDEALKLIEFQQESLKKHGRINFSHGIVHKLHLSFCDSPYVHSSSYSSTLNNLIDIFYYYKSDSLDVYSDDELISLMRNLFDIGHGSLIYLQDKILDNIDSSIKRKNID